MNGYTQISIPSESGSRKKYIVRLTAKGEWRCDCPAFVFSKDDNCKHLKTASELYEDYINN